MGLLTVVGAAVTAVGIVEYRTSANHRSATRALLLADGAATHTLALLRGPLAQYSYTDVLLGADGVPDTDDDGLLVGFMGLNGADALPDTGIQLEQGRYSVSIVNDDSDPSGDPHSDTNNRFVARCRGETPDGGMAEVRIMLAAPSFPAVATNGDLYLPGTPNIVGPCGGVHANRLIEVSGHPVISGDVTAVEDVVISGTIYDPDGNVVEPKYGPPMEIPEYDPLDYCGPADFILADGKMLVVGPPEEEHNLTGKKVFGWQYDNSTKTYNLTAKDAIEGTVCAHGNVKVIGDLGTIGDPFGISILATGSVQMTGTPAIESTHPDGILIMAAGDVQAGGNAAGTTPFYEGMVYSGSQCQVNGNALIQGHLLCYDAPDGSGMVDLFDDNKINGTPTITYDCSGEQRRTLVASWWESRLARCKSKEELYPPCLSSSHVASRATTQAWLYWPSSWRWRCSL
jgi:hypothetical protein